MQTDYSAQTDLTLQIDRAIGNSTLPRQSTSDEVWNNKHRLKTVDGEPIDITLDDTFKRVAKSLAALEKKSIRKEMEQKFIKAMRDGAIPAGRILSNAGAKKYKRSASLINCTVAPTIHDNMDSILTVAHKAGMTLKAGCGIGYEFSTIRPKDDIVFGVGAKTSGPLSFMEVFDTVCFTVRSDGGRRGAQMATFAIEHPNSEDFIKSKRQDGKLRQFNLSVLITDEFMNAVINDSTIDLVFPLRQKEVYHLGLDLNDSSKVIWREWATDESDKGDPYLKNEDGLIPCLIHETVKASKLWDIIMKSTYDFAEPGFILIDEMNRMNNLWFDENIRATNPCVTADTWVMTTLGPRRVKDLIGVPFKAWVDGFVYDAPDGFFLTGNKEVIELTTEEGFSVTLTPDHKVKVSHQHNEWVAAGELAEGDEVLLHNQTHAEWVGDGDFDDGQMVGRWLRGLNLDLESRQRLGLDGENISDEEMFEVLEKKSRQFYDGYLTGFFDHDIPEFVVTTKERLAATQRMMARIGVIGKVSDSTGYDFNFTGAKKIYRATILKKTKVPEPVPVYDVNVPGINAFDGNGFYLHNCGEQGLPPNGSCLLGSVNLTKLVHHSFSKVAKFDMDKFVDIVKTFTRMLDNVVEIHGLPLKEQADEIKRKRRHGMGYTGLGSAMVMMGMKYGSPESLEFTSEVSKHLAVAGWEVGVELAKEKGPAPIFEEDFTITPLMMMKHPEMAEKGYRVGQVVKGKELFVFSHYMQRIEMVSPGILDQIRIHGCRFTHHSSIAPTGTISLGIGNNCSNGIEPSFSHHYIRNIIADGKKSKQSNDVYSYELLLYRHLVNENAQEHSTEHPLPDYFVSADTIDPYQHIDVQAKAQYWIDSSISKTINVPTEYPFEDFKGLYLYAYKKRLKGAATFRFNPEAFQGVLVKSADLENTLYEFSIEEDGKLETKTFKGNDIIVYDGEEHTAANLFDALKEGYYGKH